MLPKKQPLDIVLQLDCWPDELSPAQLAAYKKADEEHQEVQGKLDEIVKSSGGEVVFSGENCAAYQVSGGTPNSLQNYAKSYSGLGRPPKSVQSPYGYVEHTSKGGKRASRAAALAAASAVAALDRDSDSPTPPANKKVKQQVTRSGRPTKSSYRSRSPSPPLSMTTKSTRSHKYSEPTSSKKQSREALQNVTEAVRPTEATSVGGLATGTGSSGKGKANIIVDLTKDESGRPLPDSREVSFNKLQGRTYPSLVVVARPYLRAKENVNADRTTLDAKVKSVLMHTPTKFTEWLIQQGLVRSDQVCAIHPGNRLKLGMYSDVSKFPYSGGYVWISECCPTRFVSVFSGSLFEGATHPPSVLLKLIYHWSCQTNVQNVVQWVKVDNLYVKGLFTWLRAVCTAALHQHMTMLGGNGRRIEVGVISLGTTSQDGNQRQVKVEVLGVLDPTAKLVRLRAVEPLAEGEKNYKKRFSKILEPLGNWVLKDSIILTDLTVDKGTLLTMGFKTIHQVAVNDHLNKNSNTGIMEYLRRIVPRMFQNTLSLLSRQIIQQFLDELVWREWYGNTPGTAFDNIVNHIAEQTKIDSKETLTARLVKVAANPFKNWAPPRTQAAVATPSKRGRKRTIPLETMPISITPLAKKAVAETKKPVVEMKKDTKKYSNVLPKKYKKHEKTAAPVLEKLTPGYDLVPKKPKEEKDLVALESYYYGYLEGDLPSVDVAIDMQCCECAEKFTNNVKLLDHLLSHVNPVIDKESVLCRYCLEIIPTEDELRRHIIQAHPNDTKNTMVNTLACVMCETRFSTHGLLAAHMSKHHVAFEMPYVCGTCYFRCSSHRVAIEHFYENHEGSASLQCPFCLQSMVIWAQNGPRIQTLKDFYEHLRNHMDRVTAKKCNKCALWFYDKGALRDHQLYSHISQQPLSQFIKNNCISSTMVNRPKVKVFAPKEPVTHIMEEDYDKLTIFVEDGLNCIECMGDFGDLRHFLGRMKCTKCPYVTSCSRTMLKHTATCTSATSAILIPVETMDVERHCICGFSSNDGNVLTKHLVICDRRTAYLSAEDASSNKVVRSMLDMLGLVRRAQEDPDAEDDEEEEEPTDQPEEIKQTEETKDSEETKPDDSTDKPEPEPEPQESNAPFQPVEENLVQTEQPDEPSQVSMDAPVIDTGLSLDDLAAPPSVQPAPLGQGELDIKDDYQSLATPQVAPLDNNMDNGEFEPLPAEPMPQPEFEPL